MTAIAWGPHETHPALQNTQLPARASNSGSQGSCKHLKNSPKPAHSLPHDSSHPTTTFTPWDDPGSSSSQVQRRRLQTLLGIHHHGTPPTRTN